jgi:phenylacetate-coenzyme A ligase PaaK-like adenylate-forming protein
VVSRLTAAARRGLVSAGGTQVLRYAIGDAALYLDEPCACGRSSARIRDIERVAYLEDKLVGGCERWE